MTYSDELLHYGIRGQSWGVRRGPPYPLKGGQVAKRIKTDWGSKKSRYDIYNKRHNDQTIQKSDVLTTLSYDKNRTTGTDMFYAAFKPLDKHQYNALFNKKVPQTLYDEQGNDIGTGDYYKYRINNNVKKDMKVASEDSGTDAFIKLYETNRDFYNFVRDPERMQSHFVDSKYRFKGYRESREALEKIRSSNETPSADEMQKVYRMFNYVIPSDAGGNAREAKDVATQRAKIFSELKKKGYGAMLDTNDSMYGGFKTSAPVIVFDMEQVALSDVGRVTTKDKAVSDLAFIGRKFLGK